MHVQSIDLSVNFCGIRLADPFILASAPPTANGQMIKRAFAKGWGAAVTKTIAPENMLITNVSPRLAAMSDKRGNILGLENIELISDRPLSVWEDEIRDIKECFPQKVVIASIMGAVIREEWQQMALSLEKAGADALELNFSCPHGMPEKGIGAAIGQNEELTATITRWVKEVTSIPVIVKLTPNVTDISRMALVAQAAGADSLAAINTVQCLMGIDLDSFEPLPSVGGFSSFGGLSGKVVKPIGLRCVAQIAGVSSLPISGMGGIDTWKDAAEYILVGSTTVQVCTAVMMREYGVIGGLKKGLSSYLFSKGIETVDIIRGKSLPKLVSHEALRRDSKIYPEIDGESCTGCGICVTACEDAGFAALRLEKQVVVVDVEICDGCSLCTQLCDSIILKDKVPGA